MIIEPIDNTKWIDYLRENQVDSFYFMPEMAEFYDSNINSKSCRVSIEKDGKIVGIAIGEISRQRWDYCKITKRTIYYTEPSYNGDLAVLDALLKEIQRKADGMFIQIRNSRSITDEERDVFDKNGYLFINHLDAKIYLRDKDKVWNEFEKDKRKGIRKAINKYRLEIVEKSDPEGIDEFYSLLKALYRRKRHPFKTRSYFNNLLRILGKNKARIFFACHEGVPIATQLAIFNNQVITAIYTATSPRHLDKKAGDLLVWHIINLGIEAGYHTFDFGGGGNPGKSYGPRDYKKRFGCTFNNVGRFVCPRKNIFYMIDALYEKILRR